MKCNIRKSRKHDEEEKAIKLAFDQIMREGREDAARQMLKLVCLALHERYGFGPKRCAQILSWVSDIIEDKIDFFSNDMEDAWWSIDNDLEYCKLNLLPRENEILSERRKNR